MLDLDDTENRIPGLSDHQLLEILAHLFVDVCRRLDRLTRAVSHLEADDELALEERLQERMR